jgi:uncharacterized membrane protein
MSGLLTGHQDRPIQEDTDIMSKKTPVLAAAISSLLVAGAGAIGSQAVAADMEKCYGVVKAGKNDCQTATSSCAGTSTKDAQGDAWVFLPKGSCEKVVGGSLEPKA